VWERVGGLNRRTETPKKKRSGGGGNSVHRYQPIAAEDRVPGLHEQAVGPEITPKEAQGGRWGPLRKRSARFRISPSQIAKRMSFLLSNTENTAKLKLRVAKGFNGVGTTGG